MGAIFRTIVLTIVREVTRQYTAEHLRRQRSKR